MDMNYVSGISHGYQPMVGSGGVRPQMPFEGIPLLNSGLGQTIAPLVTPFIQQQMTAHGYRPYGNTDQNMMDRNRAIQMGNAQRRLIAEAAKLEQQSYVRTAEQMWMRTRKPGESQVLPDDQRAVFQKGAEAISGLAPAAAATGFGQDVLDVMSGGNSSTNMMVNMLEGSRYRLDPTTGQYGMSEASVKAAHSQLFQEYYGGKPGEWRQKTRGFTARQMGEMVTSLQQRGMIEGGRDENTAIAALTSGRVDVEGALRSAKIDPNSIRDKSGALDVGKLSDAQLSSVAGSPEMEAELRSLDVGKVKKAADKYKGVLAAMRDIFGDAGHKNVPIQELVNAIETFTGGAMSQLDPGRLEMMVRTTHQVAKQAGVSMDQMMTMQQGFGQRAQQLGLDPVFASFATQRAATALGAYGDAGLGANAAWGKLNSSQYAQAAGNMQLSGNKSEIGNVVGAALRVEKSLGRENIRAGSKTAAYLEAIRSGSTSFVDPDTGERKWVGDVKAGEFGQMVAADAKASDGSSLMTADQAAQMVNDKHNNMGAVASGGDPTLVTRLQGEGIRRRVLAPGMATAFRGMLGDGPDAEAKTLGIADTMSKAFLTMGDANRSDDKSRTKAFRDAILAEHPEIMAQLTGTDAEKEVKLNSMIDSAYSAANYRMVNDPRNGGMTMQAYGQLHDPRAQEYMRQRQEQGRVRGMLGSEVAGVGTGSGLSKVIEALQAGKPLDAVAMELGGGVSAEQLQSTFASTIERLNELKNGSGGLKELADAQDRDLAARRGLDKEEERMDAELARAKTPEEKEAIKAKHAARRSQIGKERTALTGQTEARQKDIDAKSKVYDEITGELKDNAAAMGISTEAVEADLGESAAALTDAAEAHMEAAGMIKEALGKPVTTTTPGRKAGAVGAATEGGVPTAEKETKAEAAMSDAAAAASGSAPQNITITGITGTLTIHGDGTGTLVASGPASRHGVHTVTNTR